jgi:hypothetical protein
MKKLIPCLLLVLSLSSCGIFKRVHREKTLDKVTTATVAKSDSTSLTIDKTVTTISEKADTTISTPAKVTTGEVDFSMDSLVNGMTAVQNELIDIRFTLDPVTKKLITTALIKPQALTFAIDRTTVKANDITAQIKRVSENQTNAEETHTSTVVDKEPAGQVWYVVIILGVVVIIVFAVYRRSGGK